MTVKKLFEAQSRDIGKVEKNNLLKEFKAFEDEMSFPEFLEFLL
ncbi:hypothetical protein [Chryseobacterium wangxinyae]|nr:hypothetical protein [Chryseobacterium sp. CY353]MCY0970122.1 hypothetical protein [Chryseobacterium sp. CY353]